MVMVRRDGETNGTAGPEVSWHADVRDGEPFPAHKGVGQPLRRAELRRVERIQRELTELPLPALLRRRQLLAEECIRVQLWSRLVRARRDLLVASVVAPDALAVPLEAGTHGGPLDVFFTGSPAGGELLPSLVAHVLDPDHALDGLLFDEDILGRGELPERLRELVATGRRLADYDGALRAELALATDVLCERYRALFGTRAL